MAFRNQTQLAKVALIDINGGTTPTPSGNPMPTMIVNSNNNTIQGLRIRGGKYSNLFFQNNASNNLVRCNIINNSINFNGVILFSNNNNNTIQENYIFFNSGAGVRIFSGTGNKIRNNSIAYNSSSGILIDANINDNNDSDTGPNNKQNFPVIVSAGLNEITGTFQGASNVTLTLDFYSNTAADPSGFGEGETPLGSTTITTGGSGSASFTFNGTFVAGTFISATATDADNNTSQFSNVMAVTSPCPPALSLVSPADYINGATVIRQATASITAKNKITGNANVTYRAANFILLAPETGGNAGFVVNNGAVFPTQLIGCQ